MNNWDKKEKELEINLAKLHMLKLKAMDLAITLSEKENKKVSDESLIQYLMNMSIGEDNNTRLILRRTIGELLRIQTLLYSKFN